MGDFVTAKRFRWVLRESIKVLSLNSLLTEPRSVEVLNIDVENHELEILRTFDFDRFRPRMLIVEIHGDRIAELQCSPVYQLLEANGYEMVSWRAASCIFVHGSDLD